jgi:hypothetical protein
LGYFIWLRATYPSKARQSAPARPANAFDHLSVTLVLDSALFGMQHLHGLQLENMTPDEMLGKLRSRAGKWHKLAKFLPYLYRQGYDSTVVDQMTGITPAIQVDEVTHLVSWGEGGVSGLGLPCSRQATRTAVTASLRNQG